MHVKYVLLSLLLLLTLAYQNCGQDMPVKFFTSAITLKSEIMGGGGGYNGKPDDGYYCRVFDDIPCKTEVPNQQSLIKVDTYGIHLIQDMCSSTSLDFQPQDASVEFSPMAKNFLGVSRGIFKRCEMGSDNLPLPPTQMTDAFCVSHENNMTAVISKDLNSKTLSFNLYFSDGTSVRAAQGDSIIKSPSANGSDYASLSHNFNLRIDKMISQTARGRLLTSIDDKQIDIEMNCRSASPEATVIAEKDLELSPTWMDVSQLVGYWKLNEVNAANGAEIKDSSQFATKGLLITDNGGTLKDDASVIGGALSFDGIVDNVKVLGKDTSQYNFDRNSFTYMLWIKKTGSTGTYDIPLWHGGSSSVYPGFDIECRIGCAAYISDGLTQTTSVVTARFIADSNDILGKWVLLTAVVDRQNNQLRSYLDGTLVNTKDISSLGSINSNLDLYIGSSQGGEAFQGSIDDLMIWSRALSQSEINEIFQRLRPKFY